MELALSPNASLDFLSGGGELMSKTSYRYIFKLLFYVQVSLLFIVHKHLGGLHYL